MARKTLMSALTAVTAVGVAAAPMVHAAKPAACNLIVDPAGDDLTRGAYDGGDIVSADIASDARFVTAAIKLKHRPDDNVGWMRHYLRFDLSGQSLFLGAIQFNGDVTDWIVGEAPRTMDDESRGYYDHSDAAVRAAVKGTVSGNEYRISIPTPAFAKAYRLPASRWVFTNLGARSAFANGGALDTEYDRATSTTTYRAGTRSCVKPGS